VIETGGAVPHFCVLAGYGAGRSILRSVEPSKIFLAANTQTFPRIRLNRTISKPASGASWGHEDGHFDLICAVAPDFFDAVGLSTAFGKTYFTGTIDHNRGALAEVAEAMRRHCLQTYNDNPLYKVCSVSAVSTYTVCAAKNRMDTDNVTQCR
jgi:hypothetical protein